jgi:metal-responsive CopG/Arc/MetJ family transcriptional regulator
MTVKCISISLDAGLLERIDTQRGDVTRSRFIQRLIERILEEREVDPSRSPQEMATGQGNRWTGVDPSSE